MQLRILFVLFALLAAPLAQAAGISLETRTPIAVTKEEKAHIHMEMRQFLSTIQLIIAGINTNNMKMVAVAAHEAGMASTGDMPASVRRKLPPAFKQMGHAVHMGFDDIARDADSLGDPEQTMKQLSQVLTQCVACHSTYRLNVVRR